MDIGVSFLVAAEEPEKQRDQRAPRQQHLHQEIRTEAARALQKLFHAFILTSARLARVSGRSFPVTAEIRLGDGFDDAAIDPERSPGGGGGLR
jgi:hypothetical protein